MAGKSNGSKAKNHEDDAAWFIVAYVLSIVTGIVVLFLKGNDGKRIRFHSMQAIFLGILMIIVDIVFGLLTFGSFFIGILGILLNVFIWLYGLYVGLEAYNGRDISIPVIGDYAKRYSDQK